ncbi:MAG: hypothetical protein ACI4DX_13695 [Oliverpabstia sp.]|nr:hypothetical protein [Eubacterium sp.]MDY2593539.1 hypothetical protein [Oliverpabstia sp.]
MLNIETENRTTLAHMSLMCYDTRVEKRKISGGDGIAAESYTGQERIKK